MSYYVRYFAESPVTLKALSAAIKAVAPDYKIDGGDLMRGSDVLAEIGIDSVGSDLFVEELNARLGAIGQIGGQAAQWVGARRSEEHTSELQSRGLISYAVFCLKK